MSIRAFELVPAVERVQLMGDRAKITIECIECCGKNLYLGTNDSFIIQYVVEEKSLPNGKIAFTCTKQAHKYLGLKRPIQELKAASALNRILVSCDSTLLLLNMFDLELISSGPRIKGINSFCVNENPYNNNPFCIQLCASRRKQLMIYNVTEDKAIHVKDVGLSEQPVAMAMDGPFVCAALTTQYAIVNCETGFVQDLFPYDSLMTIPLVRRISKEEFLLNGPNALGMFVTAAGISERPPIQWRESLCSAAYSHPYVLAMNSEFISVYSILDQQLKQNLPFKGGCYVGNFDGKIYAASQTSVYAVVPIPWEKQVKALLVDQRITEALELAQHANKAGLSKEQFLKIFQRIQQQAGFIHFSLHQYDEARELFRAGQLDVRELISLYPNLLPASSSFTRASPPLHNIADVQQLCKANADEIKAAKKFLMDYLEDVRLTRLGQDYKLEIDTALLKLYADFDSSELTTLIVSSDNSYDMKECAEWLERCCRYNALGLFHRYHNNNGKALQVWTKIVTGEFSDESFAGLEFVIEFLANLDEYDLIWAYADFVLEKDQKEGVKIFTERPANEPFSDKMKPDVIVEYLHRFPQALLKYLEYLVYTKKLQKEKFHTHLSVLYLDSVLNLLKDPEVDPADLQTSRKKLQDLLQMSSLYRVQLLLAKVQETELYLEMAILYGKLEEHEKALHILVHELKDYEAAKRYCVKNTDQKDRKYKHRLFHTLLSVYLDPQQDAHRQEELILPALQLLNSELAEFDTVKVLQLLPQHWSVGVVEQFLCRSLRAALSTRRNKSIECKLNRGENIQVKFIKYDLVREPITMTEERTCAVCSRRFTTPNFTRLANGLIAHPQCSQQNPSSSTGDGRTSGNPR